MLVEGSNIGITFNVKAGSYTPANFQLKVINPNNVVSIIAATESVAVTTTTDGVYGGTLNGALVGLYTVELYEDPSAGDTDIDTSSVLLGRGYFNVVSSDTNVTFNASR